MDAERHEKPLGRGLDELSHLFMSARPAPTPGGANGSTAEPVSDEAGAEAEGASDGAAATLLRPHPRVPRLQLSGILKAHSTVLEQGLQVLDESLPCPPFGEIDLLAIDRDQRLVIVDFETTADDRLLVRGLSHADWLGRHHAILLRMYPGRSLNLSGSPRVFLLAPAFSASFRRAAQRVSHVVCTKYLAVDTGEPTNGHAASMGILFEGATDI
jgi:hypothetical protein